MRERIKSIPFDHPVIAIITVMVITALLSTGLTKLKINNDWEANLPKTNRIVKTNERYEEVFSGKDTLLVAIKTENVFNPRTLRKVAAISDEIEMVEGVLEGEVVSLSTAINIKGRDWGLEVGPFMKEVPETEDDIRQLREDVLSDPLIYKRLVSEDETTTLVLAYMERDYNNREVTLQAKKIAEKYEGPEEIYLSGNPIIEEEVNGGIQRDIIKFFPLAFGLVLAGFYIFFRNLRGVLLPLLVIVISVVWALGLMGHSGTPVSVVTTVIPVMLIAIGSSYGIHVVYRHMEDARSIPSKQEAVKHSMRRIGMPVVMSGITSAIGLLTLLVFRIGFIRQFGVFSAAGVLGALVLSVVLLPAIMMLLPLPKGERSNPVRKGDLLGRMLERLAVTSLRRQRLILIITIGIVAVSIIGISKLRLGIDPVSFFPRNHPMRGSARLFNEKLGGWNFINVMIEGEEPGDIKEPWLLREVESFQDRASKLEDVGSTDSFAQIIKQINRVMNGDDPSFYTIPDSRELIAQYLLLYSISGSPSDFARVVDYDYQRTNLTLRTPTSDNERQKELYEELSALAGKTFSPNVNVEFGGSTMVWIAFTHYIVIGKIMNIIACLVIIFLFIALIYRSAIRGMLSIVPLSVATLMTFGLMGFLGIRLNTATAIITSIAVGVGVDFAIHYISRLKDELETNGDTDGAFFVTMTRSGRAIMYDVTSNILGFMVLLFSGFVPVRNFGWLVSLTMLTSSFATLVLLPPLINYLRPAFLFGRPDAAEQSGAEWGEAQIQPPEPGSDQAP